MLWTTLGRPASISACSCGDTPRKASRIVGCARSTIRSAAPSPSPSNTPARANPCVLKVTNFIDPPSGSRHSVAVDHAAIDLDAEAGAGRHRDHALDLTNRCDGEVIAERVFLLLEFQHR